MSARVIPLEGSSRYVIERELGQGGMGVVYEARDLERNTRVALKALHNTDAANIYRLKHEFRQLADLSHPNLVSLHELCFDGDKWFFTMELVDGETFDDYVLAANSRTPQTPSRSSLATVEGRHRSLRDVSVTLSQRAIGGEFPLTRVTCDVGRLRHALRQLIEAIAALHDAGKLHRDIKPSNVLVTSGGRVVVLDFGLVSNSTYVDPEAQDAERSVGGVVFGTPAYMSPEQAAGEPVTTASDWYSIGAMLYEALTGQLPFDGTVLQILKQKDELEPIPAADVVSGVPDDLDQLCRSLLHRDPKRRPGAQEILRYLSGTSSHHLPAYDANAAAPSTRHSGELFVGRETHLARLRDGFNQARTGTPATVFVHGHSGMGKSALVRCFANELIKNDEAVVLRGRCYERESVPYKAFDDVIDALSRYLMRLPSEKAAELLPRNIHALARLFPVLRRVKAVAQAQIPVHQSNDPLEIRGQAFSALKDLLLRLSDWHPLVINIDDLQWGDMDSARLLSHILGPPDAPPILFVGAYRREERYTSAFLRHVLGDDANTPVSGVDELAVDALAPEEAEHLTRELLRELPAATAMFTRTIAADSEGVPFFIGELAQHVKGQDGVLPATLDSVSLDNVIMTRITSMSPEAQSVLEVLSVAARPLEQGMLLEAAGLPTGDRAALLALRAARLIRTRGTRQSDVAETYHDRVRETVAAQLNAQRARDIHACIARASEAWGVGEPEQLVVHYSEAGEGMRAGETAIHAAHAAAEKFAFNRAAELYRKAIELLDDSDVARKLDLSKHMASALANAGYGARAAEVYLRVSQSAPTDDRRALRLQAAQQLLRSGRFEPGLELTKQLLSEVKLSYPGSSAVALASYLGHTAFLSLRGFEPRRRPVRGVSLLEQERLRTLRALFQEVGVHDGLRGALMQVQLLRHALAAGDPDCMLQGLAWACCFLSVQGGSGNLRRADEALASVDELARELNTPYAEATRKMAITSSFLFGKARFRDALEPALEAEDLLRTRCVGASWEANWVAQLRYTALEFAGDLSALLHEIPGRERESAERSDQYSLGLLIQSVPLAHLMRDSPQHALDFLSAQAPKLGPGFSTFHFTMLVRTVDTLLYQGQGQAALAHVNAQWSALTGTLLYRGRMTRASSHLLRARAALMAYRQDPRPELLQLAWQDARVLGKLRSGFLGFESAILAQIAQTKGDREAAVGHYKKAIADFRSEQADRSALYAQLRLAELLEDDAGRQCAEATRAELQAQGIQHVERWVAMQMPLSLHA